MDAQFLVHLPVVPEAESWWSHPFFVEMVGGAAGTLLAAPLLLIFGRFFYSRLQARRVQFQYVALSTTADSYPGRGQAHFVRVRNDSAGTVFALQGSLRKLHEPGGDIGRSVLVNFIDTDKPVPYSPSGQLPDPPCRTRCSWIRARRPGATGRLGGTSQ